YGEKAPEPWVLSDARAPLDVDASAVPAAPATQALSALPTPPKGPPPEVAPFDLGYLERHPTMCWMALAPPDPCPPHAECKPPASWAHVTCPPTLAKHDKAHR